MFKSGPATTEAWLFYSPSTDGFGRLPTAFIATSVALPCHIAFDHSDDPVVLDSVHISPRLGAQSDFLCICPLRGYRNTEHDPYAADRGNRSPNRSMYPQGFSHGMVSLRAAFVAEYLDAAHQRRTGGAATVCFLPSDRTSAAGNQIYSIAVSSTLATITGKAVVPASDARSHGRY